MYGDIFEGLRVGMLSALALAAVLLFLALVL